VDATPRYRIRVGGRLGPEWSARLAGLTLVVHEPAGRPVATDITGPIPDQAALVGILRRLYNAGATLLAVECLDDERGASAGRGDRTRG